MIAIEKIRELVIEPLGDNRPAYVTSASGLVRLDNRVYIVADDELHLAVFDLKSSQPGRWLRLLPGMLSSNYKERKKQKADLEAITRLQPDVYAAAGALLVVPSMSRANRVSGAMIKLEKDLLVNESNDSPIPIDFSDIRNKLTESIDGLNVEGIAIQEKVTKLFHRGSKKKGKSAVVELETAAFLHDLHDTHKPKSTCISKLREYDLGDIEGVGLSFTDAVPMPDGRIVFLAAAEATDDEYQDGACLGSSLGIMKENGDIESIVRLSGREKFEGICADYSSVEISQGVFAHSLEILLVSDTDNERFPSNLYQGSLSLT
ncbi:hypothetical protein KBI23_21035 [bacterium]|nr:hypothetical protein [bacterium]MBP9807165.1 hypothetical protein [bacterium]